MRSRERPTAPAVASSDMSHYGPTPSRERRTDAIRRMLALDPEGSTGTVRTERTRCAGCCRPRSSFSPRRPAWRDLGPSDKITPLPATSAGSLTGSGYAGLAFT